MCKQRLNEDLEHIFVKCKHSIEFYNYVKENYLHKKNRPNTLDLLKYKRGMAENDFKALSCFVYVVWRIRNKCRIEENDENHMVNFKAIFNKWFITISNI